MQGERNTKIFGVFVAKNSPFVVQRNVSPRAAERLVGTNEIASRWTGGLFVWLNREGWSGKNLHDKYLRGIVGHSEAFVAAETHDPGDVIADAEHLLAAALGAGKAVVGEEVADEL